MEPPKNVLLTGFGAFGSVVSNPTERLVRHFENRSVPGLLLTICILPVSYSRAPAILLDQLERGGADGRPFDIVWMLGVAARTSYWRVERFGHNQNRAAPDADGVTPPYRIEVDGPAKLEVSVPVQSIVSELTQVGLPARESRAAGAYLCNHILYTTLRQVQRANCDTGVGFLHVPADPDTMEAGKSPAGQHPFETHILALDATLKALAKCRAHSAAPDPAA